MIWYQQLLPHIPLFVAVLSRLSGLMIFAPVLSSNAIPIRARAMLVIAMSFVVYPTLDHASYEVVPLELYALVPMIVGELLIGTVIGLMALLPIISVQLAGLVMSQQLGLRLAEQFNPALNISSDGLAQLLFMTTTASFLYVGGLELLYAAVVYTFAAVPMGGIAVTEAPVEMLVGLLSSGFVLAVRVAMPVLAIIALETVAMAFITKTVPTINALSFGFPIRIMIGLVTFTFALTAMKHTLMDELNRVMDMIEQYALSLGGPLHG